MTWDVCFRDKVFNILYSAWKLFQRKQGKSPCQALFVSELFQDWSIEKKVCTRARTAVFGTLNDIIVSKRILESFRINNSTLDKQGQAFIYLRYFQRQREREREKEREREREREREKERERERERDTERQRQRQRERHRERHRERQRDRETERDRETDREKIKVKDLFT